MLICSLYMRLKTHLGVKDVEGPEDQNNADTNEEPVFTFLYLGFPREPRSLLYQRKQF